MPVGRRTVDVTEQIGNPAYLCAAKPTFDTPGSSIGHAFGCTLRRPESDPGRDSAAIDESK
jgi:hypothetical protein